MGTYIRAILNPLRSRLIDKYKYVYIEVCVYNYIILIIMERLIYYYLISNLYCFKNNESNKYIISVIFYDII